MQLCVAQTRQPPPPPLGRKLMNPPPPPLPPDTPAPAPQATLAADALATPPRTRMPSIANTVPAPAPTDALAAAAKADGDDDDGPSTFHTEVEVETEADTFIVKFEGEAASVPLEVEKHAGSESLGVEFGKVRKRKDETLDEAMDRVRQMPGVLYVEPSYVYRPAAVPNDPQFGSQWGMAKIKMPEAWNLATGSAADSNGLVCVVDTGLDSSHPDLAANVPAAYKAGYNAITDAVGAGEVARDSLRHGTHCAGVIGGVGGNGIGISGVNQGAQVIGCKFIDDVAGYGTTIDAVQCIDWCIAQGATISSHSWCGPGYSQALYDAISAAQMVGHLVVAAAGNNAVNNNLTPSYPASYNLPNIIAVAATNQNDSLATFSNYGNVATDIAAPGVDVLSTIPWNVGSYLQMSGTSMATPHVAGVAALIRSATGGAIKSATQLRSIILNSADSVPALVGKVGTKGNRLNAFAALQAALAAVPEPLPPLFNASPLTVGTTIPWTSSSLSMTLGTKFAVPRALLSTCPTTPVATGSLWNPVELLTATSVTKLARKLEGLPAAGGGNLTVSNCGASLRWNSLMIVLSCATGTTTCTCYADNDGCGTTGGLSKVSGVPLEPGRDYYAIVMPTAAVAVSSSTPLTVNVTGASPVVPPVAPAPAPLTVPAPVPAPAPLVDPVIVPAPAPLIDPGTAPAPAPLVDPGNVTVPIPTPAPEPLLPDPGATIVPAPAPLPDPGALIVPAPAPAPVPAPAPPVGTPPVNLVAPLPPTPPPPVVSLRRQPPPPGRVAAAIPPPVLPPLVAPPLAMPPLTAPAPLTSTPAPTTPPPDTFTYTNLTVGAYTATAPWTSQTFDLTANGGAFALPTAYLYYCGLPFSTNLRSASVKKHVFVLDGLNGAFTVSTCTQPTAKWNSYLTVLACNKSLTYCSGCMSANDGCGVAGGGDRSRAVWPNSMRSYVVVVYGATDAVTGDYQLTIRGV